MPTNEKSKAKYHTLFTTAEQKAVAFDKIAEEYYFGNFGCMQKSDLEVLLFSIYIESIMDKSYDKPNTYSDYTLSKSLGITPRKIHNLKEKKQISYPYANFNWKDEFLKLCKNARCENGKIKINVPDPNVYNEVQNAIDENGGYIEIPYTNNVMQIPIEDFIDVYMLASNEENKKAIIKELKKEFAKKQKDTAKLDNAFNSHSTIASICRKLGVEITKELIVSAIPTLATALITLASH